MDQQITDEEYQMATNINGLNVSITVTQSNIWSLIQAGQSNNQPDMNMQINSEQMNQLPFIESIIINNQNVLIQNNNQFENQPNNIFNHRKIVIKNIQEIIYDNEKGETLRQQIKKQDNEQNIRNLIANKEQTIQNLYQEINNLKQVVKKKDEQIKQYGQNNSNEQQQNIISPLIKRPKMIILDEAPLKPKKNNQIRTRTLNLAKSLVNNAQSSRWDFQKKTQLRPLNLASSLIQYVQGFHCDFKKKTQLKQFSSIKQKFKPNEQEQNQKSSF